MAKRWLEALFVSGVSGVARVAGVATNHLLANLWQIYANYMSWPSCQQA